MRVQALAAVSITIALGGSATRGQAAARLVARTSVTRPLHALGLLRRPTNLRVAPDTQGRRLALLHAGVTLALDGWTVDTDGVAWYHSGDTHLYGWIDAANVVLQRAPASGQAATLAVLAIQCIRAD